MEEKVEKVLNCAIDRVNELLPTGEPLSKEKDTVLLGENGNLDSMGFVNLVVAIEDELEKQLGVKVVLSDEVKGGDRVLTVGGLHEMLGRIVRDHKP
jgi:D-alanine--poly(phosphoribitol) ligase subunit 2